jgi:CheY-like chemotaxis protein
MPRWILVVDNNAMGRRGLRYLFARDADYKIGAEAIDWRDAIEKAGAQHFDLALVDFSGASAEGIETVSRLKRIRPDMPIVVLTDFKDSALEKKVSPAFYYDPTQPHTGSNQADIAGLLCDLRLKESLPIPASGFRCWRWDPMTHLCQGVL